MYFRSLSEILASLICIINSVRLEFQIQTLFFLFKPSPLWNLFCNSNSYIHVCPTKFNFVKIKSRGNFGEFIRFFPKVLVPFKIHSIFKF
jgi:hypothetical protein